MPCGLGLPGTVRDADPAWGYWVVCEDGAWGSLGSPEAGAVLGAGREGSGGGLEPLGRDPGVSGPRADGRLVRVQLCARPCHAHASQAAPGAEHAQLLSGAGCGGGTLGRTARPGARPAAPPAPHPGAARGLRTAARPRARGRTCAGPSGRRCFRSSPGSRRPGAPCTLACTCHRKGKARDAGRRGGRRPAALPGWGARAAGRERVRVFLTSAPHGGTGKCPT